MLEVTHFCILPLQLATHVPTLPLDTQQALHNLEFWQQARALRLTASREEAWPGHGLHMSNFYLTSFRRSSGQD